MTNVEEHVRWWLRPIKQTKPPIPAKLSRKQGPQNPGRVRGRMKTQKGRQ